jgi:hypothetical protein
VLDGRRQLGRVVQLGLVGEVDVGRRWEDDGLDEAVEHKRAVYEQAETASCIRLYGNRSTSHPRPSDTIQMPRVRHVSIVERVVALTRDVTLRPKKLNAPMLIAIASEAHITGGLLMIWCQPRGTSKYDDFLWNARWRKGMAAAVVRPPNVPSRATAASGSIE